MTNKLQPGDTVLVQNHVRGPFDPKFTGDYRVVSLKGNQVEIQPANEGLTEMKHIKHVKYILPADQYISHLPDYSKFGRKTTLKMNPDYIQDLHWKLTNAYHTTSIGCATMLPTTITVMVETLNDTTERTYEKWCGTNLSTMTLTTQSK